MPELVSCPGCERKLRLPDDLLGKEVKCPTCGTQFLAKVGEAAPSSEGEPSPPSPVMSMELPPREDPPPGVQPRPSQRSPERGDDEADVPSSRRRSREDDDDDDDRLRRRRRRDDYDDDDYGRRRYLTPHRGSTILVLGILSLCVCGIILGPIAFFMGNADIAAMDAGTMDPSGRGQTNAGRICGLIGGILHVVLLLVRILAVANNMN
jgi:hypothetical protein